MLYVGDRQRQPNQINGKAANINHVVTQKIYPGATSADDIPENDILMIMDCDHMCKPDIFNRMGPCMRNRSVGVTLVPQWFHNLILPGMQHPSLKGSKRGQCGKHGANTAFRHETQLQLLDFIGAKAGPGQCV
jgi:hypothetical protein